MNNPLAYVYNEKFGETRLAFRLCKVEEFRYPDTIIAERAILIVAPVTERHKTSAD